MDIRLIIGIISYLLVFASIISIPIKRKSIDNISGKLILGFPKNKPVMTIIVDIVSLILITSVNLILKNYSLLIIIILCGCGVLGAWIVAGDAAMGPKYGLYENGIIAAGKFISYDDIITFPILNLPIEEQKNHPDNVLSIATRKYGLIDIVFSSEEVCNQVIKKLDELGEIK